MSDMDKQKSNQAVPFFARYLEGQIDFIEEISEEETQSVTGGKGISRKHAIKKKVSVCGGGKSITKPSGKEDVVTTKKYPSDSDEDISGSVVTTQKYPSDNEDVSGGGGIVTTLKFPSDNEDTSGAVLE